MKLKYKIVSICSSQTYKDASKVLAIQHNTDIGTPMRVAQEVQSSEPLKGRVSSSWCQEEKSEILKA